MERGDTMPHPIAGLLRRKYRDRNADLDAVESTYSQLVQRFIAGERVPEYPAAWNNS